MDIERLEEDLWVHRMRHVHLHVGAAAGSRSGSACCVFSVGKAESVRADWATGCLGVHTRATDGSSSEQGILKNIAENCVYTYYQIQSSNFSPCVSYHLWTCLQWVWCVSELCEVALAYELPTADCISVAVMIWMLGRLQKTADEAQKPGENLVWHLWTAEIKKIPDRPNAEPSNKHGDTIDCANKCSSCLTPSSLWRTW